MSRGFDGFEIDDFRDSQWQSEPSSRSRESSRGRGSSSQTDASVRIKPAKLRETEYQSDHLDWQSRERPEVKPPPLSRDTRQADLLAQRERTEILDRDRSYSLRPSEIHTLTEVGKFRVVAVEDIANHAYAGDRSRLDSDLRNLIHQRLVERRSNECSQNQIAAGSYAHKAR
jgi:DNA-binding transcriptional MocR family regulator